MKNLLSRFLTETLPSVWLMSTAAVINSRHVDEPVVDCNRSAIATVCQLWYVLISRQSTTMPPACTLIKGGCCYIMAVTSCHTRPFIAYVVSGKYWYRPIPAAVLGDTRYLILASFVPYRPQELTLLKSLHTLTTLSLWRQSITAKLFVVLSLLHNLLTSAAHSGCSPSFLLTFFWASNCSCGDKSWPSLRPSSCCTDTNNRIVFTTIREISSQINY